MIPDQCHGEPKPTEIIPNTSKYDDLPNKLRAFAEILATGAQVQCKTTAAPNDLRWTDSNTPVAEQLEFLVSGVDYRAKPQPRELWAVYDETGARRATYDELDSTDLMRPPGWTVVRFVEQPELTAPRAPSSAATPRPPRRR